MWKNLHVVRIRGYKIFYSGLWTSALLFTSRLRETVRVADRSVDMPPMSEEAVIQLLVPRSGPMVFTGSDIQMRLFKEAVQVLECLPHALDQAGHTSYLSVIII